jgi:hypothetical protein
VNRETVNRIAARVRRGEEEYVRRAPAVHSPSGPPRRCPGCGGRVQLPCVVCQVRAHGPVRGFR